jgi:hypothetical protein
MAVTARVKNKSLNRFPRLRLFAFKPMARPLPCSVTAFLQYDGRDDLVRSWCQQCPSFDSPSRESQPVVRTTYAGDRSLYEALADWLGLFTLK